MLKNGTRMNTDCANKAQKKFLYIRSIRAIRVRKLYPTNLYPTPVTVSICAVL